MQARNHYCVIERFIYYLILPSGMKDKISITLDKEIIKKIKELAKDSHMNFSSWLNQFLWNNLPKNKK